MLVNRRTSNVKFGRTEDVVAMLKAATEEFASYTNDYRIYISETGVGDVVAVEWEYENFEEYERLWSEWGSQPESAAFMEKMWEMLEHGGTNQIWRKA